MVSLRTHLWFITDGHAAAEFYVSLIPDSSIDAVHAAPEGVPGVAEGEPFLIDLTLGGVPVTILTAGPHVTIDEAFSFVLVCDDQEEIDHYWSALIADGGRESQCGWCVDRFGLSWQVVPRVIDALTMGSDEASTRARTAMFAMGKLDLPALQAAYDGTASPSPS